jgi:hypothetical protein
MAAAVHARTDIDSMLADSGAAEMDSLFGLVPPTTQCR